MQDYFNNILNKLVNAIDGVENEKEMLIRLIVGLAVFIVLAIFRKQISKAIVWLSTKTIASKSKKAQQALINHLTKPLSVFIVALSIYISSEIIVPSGSVRNAFLLILKLALILCTAWFAIGFIGSDFSFFSNEDDSKTKKTAITFINNFIKACIAVIAVLLVLEQFGISATRIFAALGIGGIAIAFACKDAVENMLSGFIIIFDKPFEVEDAIQVDGEVGTVEDIKIRTTRLRMVDGSQKIYPNTTIANAPIVNFSRMEKRSFEEVLCINYSHNGKETADFCNSLKELLLQNEHIIKDDVRVNFTNFGESALEISIFFYVDITAIAEYQNFKCNINSQIKDFADKAGVELAFNSRTIYFGDELKVNK